MAKTAKTELDTSTQKAGTAKNALDESIEIAGTVNETLSATVKQAGALDTSLGEKIETGTQLKTDLTASGEKAVQDIQKAGSEQLGKMQAVAEAFTADREQITTNKEDIGSLKEDLVNLDSPEKKYIDGDVKNMYIQLSEGKLIEKANKNFSYTKIKIDDTMLSVSCNITKLFPTNVLFFGFVNSENNLITKNVNTTGLQTSKIPENATHILLNFFGVSYCGEFIIGVDNYARKSYVDSLREEQPYLNKKGVAFGTSLTYRAKTTGGYLQFLPKLSGIEFDNQGVGSSKIYGNDSNSILNKILNYSSYADKDVVLIEGFANDWYNNSPLGDIYDITTDTVCGCLYTAFKHILTQKASINIAVILDHFGINAQGVDMSASVTKNVGKQLDYYEKLAKVCEIYGVSYIKEYKNAKMNQMTNKYYLDYIHLNEIGSEQSARCIWSKLKNIPISL